ncbi:hypothetical protein DIPPA_50587, partial [Diplonema papillatum]
MFLLPIVAAMLSGNTPCLSMGNEEAMDLTVHVVACDKDSVDAKPLQRFEFESCIGNTGNYAQFATACPANFSAPPTCREKRSDCIEMGNMDSHFKFNVSCNTGEVMTWWKLDNTCSAGGNVARITFGCCDGAVATSTERETGCKDKNTSTRALFGHNVECPADSYLRGWRWTDDSCSIDKMAFEYTCTELIVPTDAPPTNAPPTDAPLTTAPFTDVPPTGAPPTDSPPTVAPSTDAPPTNAPPTHAPLTEAPLTDAPRTDAPPTGAPPTNAPPTDAPPTN